MKDFLPVFTDQQKFCAFADFFSAVPKKQFTSLLKTATRIRSCRGMQSPAAASDARDGISSIPYNIHTGIIPITRDNDKIWN